MAERIGSVSGAARLMVALLLIGIGANAQSTETPGANVGTTAIAPPAEPANEPTRVATSVQPRSQSAQELAARFQRLLGRPGGLTSGQVSSRAVSTSYQVRAKEGDVQAAAAEVDKALIRFFPELTVVARYTRLSTITPGTLGPSDGSMVVSPTGQQGPLPPNTPLVGAPFSALSFPVILNQFYLASGVVVPLSDYFLRINRAYEAAQHSTEASRLVARAERLATATNAKLAYYAWVRACLQQVVVEQTLGQALEHRKNAQAGLDAGRLSTADVMRAEAQVASTELLLAQAQRLSATTEDLMRTQMHDPGARHYEIGEDVLTVKRALEPFSSVDQFYADALRRRLELRAMDRSLAGLNQTSRAALAAAVPRLGAFADAYYANPNPRIIPQSSQWKATWDAGVELTWTPTGILFSRADVSSIDAQRSRLLAERGLLTDALRAQVVDAYHALLEASTDVQSAERGLSAAEESYRVRRLWFERGRATGVELTDAETALLQARLGMINARLNLVSARIKLEHATGRDAPPMDRNAE
jgi:outer membrane protein TolC